MTENKATQLFRARYPFVCDRCDLGYKAGRLAGWESDRRMVCATCLLGADPDDAVVVCTDPAHRRRDHYGNCLTCNPTSQESPRCPTSNSTGRTASTSPDSAPSQGCLPGMPD